MSARHSNPLHRRAMNSPLSQENPRLENGVERLSEYGPLTLHVPEAAVRPGGTPDFSNVRIPQAGSVACPDIDADPETIRDLAYSIIRVLNREGEAVGPWAGLLSDAELLEGLRHMMTLRAFDARMQMVQRRARPPSICSTWARRPSVAPFARRLPRAI